MSRKLFVWCIVASFFAGCSSSEDSNSGGTHATGCNHNGVLDPGEICDGEEFSTGQDKCPTGTTGKPVCTSECRVDTANCIPIDIRNCGNGELDKGEECDGANFSTGLDKCPDGTIGNPVCTPGCTVDNSGCETKDELCGNSRLDTGEICDGVRFSRGFGKCPTETVGKPACTDVCTIDLSGCVPKQDGQCTAGQNACDSSRTWYHCEMERMQTEDCRSKNLLCDPTIGCVECFDGDFSCTEDGLKLLECQDNHWIEKEDCSASGEICSAGLGICEPECTDNSSRCTESGYFEICVSGLWLSEDCGAEGECSLTDGCTTLSYECHDNTLKMCETTSRDDCIEQNCTPLGALCSAEAGDCVNSAFTCDGSTIRITGTDFSYNCEENMHLPISAQQDDVLCNTYHGCSEATCVGNDLKISVGDASRIQVETVDTCDAGACSDRYYACMACEEEAKSCNGDVLTECVKGLEVVRDCSLVNWKCDVSKGGCYNPDPCETDTTRCQGQVFSVCVDKTWLSETCEEGKTCDLENGCVATGGPVCGNGIREIGEACDGSDIYKTCEDFDPNMKWKEGGKPACREDCLKVITGTCELKETEVIKSYEFTDLDSVIDYMRQDDVELKGGFKTSKISEDGHNGWTLGIWGNGTEPQLDNRYVAFNIGNASDYDSAFVKFDIRRTSTGPKKFAIGFYNGDELISQINPIEITTKYVNHQISIPQFSEVAGDLSIHISGYESYSSKAGSLTITNVSVFGTRK